jgi:hypothetical protein
MAQHLRSIETPVGVLFGRDTIFLDEFRVAERTTEVWLRGSIVGTHGSRPQSEYLDYLLSFRNVLAFKVVELESSQAYGLDGVFGEVMESDWLKELAHGDKFTDDHRHYFVQTYDDVVEVVATDHDLRITGRSPRES